MKRVTTDMEELNNIKKKNKRKNSFESLNSEGYQSSISSENQAANGDEKPLDNPEITDMELIWEEWADNEIIMMICFFF